MYKYIRCTLLFQFFEFFFTARSPSKDAEKSPKYSTYFNFAIEQLFKGDLAEKKIEKLEKQSTSKVHISCFPLTN